MRVFAACRRRGQVSVELMATAVLWMAVTAVVYVSVTGDFAKTLASDRAHSVSRAANALTALSDYGLVVDSAAWVLDAPRLESSSASRSPVTYAGNSTLVLITLADGLTASKSSACTHDFFESFPANARAVWRVSNHSCVVGSTS